MNKFRNLLPAVLLLAGLPGAADPASARTRALVVGINEYRTEKNLMGAVNDARDIAGALRSMQVTDLVVLEDAAARRSTITATWDRMVAQAEPGDVLLFAFAGHGALEDARRPGTPNGKSTVLLLSQFGTTSPASGERLPDDLLDAMFAKAERKPGVLVLVLADACYSGGLLTRQIDRRVEALPDRSVPPYVIAEDALPLPDAETPPAGVTHENRLFFSSSAFDRKTPEVLIDGRPRGALSWAFARALRGEADRQKHGSLTEGDLVSYVVAAVRSRAEWTQTPGIDGGGEDDRVVFVLPDAQKTGQVAAAPVAVRVQGAAPAQRAQLLAALHDVTGVETGADLIWDAAKNEVISSLGDIVAQGITDATHLQAVVDKWQLLHWLDGRGGGGLDIALSPGDQPHPAGTIIQLTVTGRRQPALLLFNLAGDGTVQRLYPMAGEPATRPAGNPYAIETRVRPPFGADHVVAIASAVPLPDLQGFLDLHDGQPTAAALRPILQQVMERDHTVQVAVHGLYTGP